MLESSAIESSGKGAALIVAAGVGKRMGATTRKQYLALAGDPILFHTLRAFEACPSITAITLVAPPQEIDWVAANILKPLHLKTPVTLCAGGRERQDSVRLGLEAIDPAHRLVAIHDGVRPLIQPHQIEACLAAAADHGAAILAVPVADTLKKSGAKQMILKTVSRESIWLAQTPQTFNLDLIRRAHQEAFQNGVQGTDDAALVERLGLPVHLVHGSRRNIKVTAPEDLILAEAFLASTER